MWLDALIIIIAIVCIATLLYLRVVLMIAFPPLVTRRLPEGLPLPAATADLYEKAAAELAALGFSPPQWIVIAPEKETPGAFATVAAIFCHAEKQVLAMLHPPLNIAAPNELVTHFITRLADGRKLTTQVRDAYSEAVADGKHPAQTITGATLAEQWAKHLLWAEGFKTPAAVGFGSLETLPEELQTIRGDDVRLVGAGKLWRDAQGVARPTLAFALRLLRFHWTRPRPAANKTNVPLARQVMFATFNEHWQKRPLPARWQWLLLLMSSVLFVALGAIFWEPALALTLLGVIILHEGGHYLAMRALGYRHVQMLALPLLGGVTIGFEQKPSAARRAWMAMMGPLPGIVLGWALLYLAIANGFSGETLSATIMAAAIVLLLINYLNLLPIPPLDGAHIVQAMLPPRWLIARTVFFVLACIAGAAIAAYFGIYLLALLALLQLIWAPSLLVSDRAVRLLAADASFGSASPDQQRRRVLETLQQCVGETANMARRLQQAQTVTAALTQTAMGWIHRTILATLYLGLLCLPLMVVWLVMMEISAPLPPPLRIDPEIQKQTQQRIFLSLGEMTVPQLLARMPEPEPPAQTGGSWLARLRKPAPPPPLPAPADYKKVTAAQNRLGVSFPDDYRELLSRHDGYPPLKLLPVTQIRHLSETDFFSDEDIQAPRPFYSFAFPPSSFEGTDAEIVPGQRVWRGEELRNCAVIGGQEYANQKDAAPAEVTPMLLWCPGPAFEQARIVSLSESLWAPDFTTYLRYKITQKIADRELAGNNAVQK